MSPTRRAYLRRTGALGGALAGVGLAGCTQSGLRDRPETTVRIGSKPFPEQELLGSLAYYRLQTIEDIQVVDEIGYGDSRTNWNAVVEGEKDLYWEYTGTAWTELPPHHTEQVTDPRRLYERVAADAREQGVEMANPAPFSNEWTVVADRAWSDRTGIRTLSGLADHVSSGNTDFGVAFNEDFYHRPDAWDGMANHYGIDTETRAELESGTFIVTSAGLTYELLADGRVQVGSGFATDPQPDRRSIVELVDDRDYFLAYQPAPAAHAPTVEARPAIFERLAPIAASLDSTTIRRLNGQMLVDGRTPRAVARSYLEELGGNE